MSRRRDLDKITKYVREYRIGPLLNDMLIHVQNTQPADPYESLITYLEKRKVEHESKPVPTPQPPSDAPSDEAGTIAGRSRILSRTMPFSASGGGIVACGDGESHLDEGGDAAHCEPSLPTDVDAIFDALRSNEEAFMKLAFKSLQEVPSGESTRHDDAMAVESLRALLQQAEYESHEFLSTLVDLQRTTEAVKRQQELR